MSYSFDDWKAGALLPKGWDLADAVDDGWTREQIESFMRDLVEPYSPPAVIVQQPEPEPAHAVETSSPKYDDNIPTGSDVPLSKHPMRDEILTLREWVYMTRDGVFFHRGTGEMEKKEAFDLSKAPLVPWVNVQKKPGDEPAPKKLDASKTLLHSLGGECVYNDMYRPDVDDDFFFVDGVRYVNSFLKRTVPAVDPHWQSHDGWVICQGHIYNAIPDGAKTIIQWMAHNVQYPGRKIRWSPILVGVQGDGKTTIADMIKAALGAANVKDVTTDELFSSFHDYAEGAAVRVIDEILVDGERRTAAMNKLKPFITNDVVSIVPKGRRGKTILNRTNYIALTNHIDALAIDETDRRWGVFKTRFESREQLVRETGEAYFTRIHEVIREHPGVIRGWLLNVDLSDFNPDVAPAMTEAKRMMIEASRTNVNSDVREAIELGGEGIHADVLVTDLLNEAVKGIGGRALSTRTMASILHECGWVPLEKVMRWNGKTRRVYYRRGSVPDDLDFTALASILKMKLDETVGARDNLSSDLEQW